MTCNRKWNSRSVTFRTNYPCKHDGNMDHKYQTQTCRSTIFRKSKLTRIFSSCALLFSNNNTMYLLNITNPNPTLKSKSGNTLYNKYLQHLIMNERQVTALKGLCILCCQTRSKIAPKMHFSAFQVFYCNYLTFLWP